MFIIRRCQDNVGIVPKSATSGETNFVIMSPLRPHAQALWTMGLLITMPDIPKVKWKTVKYKCRTSDFHILGPGVNLLCKITLDMLLSMFLMVTKMVLPVAKEEGTPVARPDGRRWVCPAHLPHVSQVPNVPQCACPWKHLSQILLALKSLCCLCWCCCN